MKNPKNRSVPKSTMALRKRTTTCYNDHHVKRRHFSAHQRCCKRDSILYDNKAQSLVEFGDELTSRPTSANSFSSVIFIENPKVIPELVVLDSSDDEQDPPRLQKKIRRKRLNNKTQKNIAVQTCNLLVKSILDNDLNVKHNVDPAKNNLAYNESNLLNMIEDMHVDNAAATQTDF